MLASLALALLCTNPAVPAAPDDGFYLKGGETVVFFGDSITEAGTYVEYIETFLLTRFPDKRFRIVNRGISSETISGTSEPDHDPRRPCAHDRFTRDVASEKPDVIVACFGMNDGNYHPFDHQRFDRFKDGIRRLIDRTRKETRANLVILTPPPFDPYRRLVLDPQAKTYGYKYAAIDYDTTLEQYSRWLTALKEKDVLVVGLHSAMNEHLRKRRTAQVSFSFQRDGIHPDPTGHWLMAQTLLTAWQAPDVAADAWIDTGQRTVLTGQVTNLNKEGPGLSFEWQSPLPMPTDPKWDAESIRLEDVRGRLNNHWLTVKGLPPGQYRLTADGEEFATGSAEQLAAGLSLLDFGKFPANRAAARLLSLVHDRQRLLYAAWRRSVGKWTSIENDALNRTSVEELRRQADELEQQIDLLRRAQPIRVRVELIPAGSRQSRPTMSAPPAKGSLNGQ